MSFQIYSVVVPDPLASALPSRHPESVPGQVCTRPSLQDAVRYPHALMGNVCPPMSNHVHVLSGSCLCNPVLNNQEHAVGVYMGGWKDSWVDSDMEAWMDGVTDECREG